MFKQLLTSVSLALLSTVGPWVPSSWAAEIPFTSIGLNNADLLAINPGVTFNDASTIWAPIASVSQPYEFDLYSIVSAGIGWETQERGYKVTFTADPNLIPSGAVDANGHTIFKLDTLGRLGVTLIAKDASFPEVWVENQQENCLFGSACWKNMWAGGIGLNFTTNIYFTPGAITDQNVNIVTPEYISGVITLGKGLVYQRSQNGAVVQPNVASFSVNLIYRITLLPTVCILDPSTPRIVNLGTVTVTDIEQAGGRYPGANDLTLDFQCPTYASININLQIEDKNDPSNTATYLTLKPGASSATGIGIELENPYNHLPIAMSRLQPPVRILSGTNKQSTVSVVLRTFYKKIGTITPGQVEAQATLFISYD